MATTEQIKQNKKAAPIAEATGRRAKGRAKTPTTERPRGRRVAASAYAAPGAALLATGVLAAAGYALREKLGAVVTDALKVSAREAATVARATSGYADDARDHARAAVDRVLHAAGLEQRRPVAAILAPAMGVACGLVAGAVLSYFFAPKLLELLGMGGTPGNDVDSAAADGAPKGGDAARTNGSATVPVS